MYASPARLLGVLTKTIPDLNQYPSTTNHSGLIQDGEMLGMPGSEGALLQDELPSQLSIPLPHPPNPNLCLFGRNLHPQHEIPQHPLYCPPDNICHSTGALVAFSFSPWLLYRGSVIPVAVPVALCTHCASSLSTNQRDYYNLHLRSIFNGLAGTMDDMDEL